ncbi:guanylate-binding protein 6-like isoform X1 [Aquarana catesbeiana]|uniref:guanylate-binding protein 6-like isoform X1 n=1 Tax=Aquarana catesbeiana TaxID=8400 RepID=UPI003CCA4B85
MASRSRKARSRKARSRKAHKRNINGELIVSSSTNSEFKMNKPVCLIENRINNGRAQLMVNPESIKILSKIHQPVVVVSIVGRYRTGKSYLMNRLAGAQKGFSLGSTIQAQTQGIWMWYVPHPNYEDRVLVLLDTEGLGDVEKGDTSNDSKIFTLAVLLSSALIYNGVSTICQDDLDKLKYVGELTELIKVRTDNIQDKEAAFSTYFPIFIWAVRDFSLELELNGEPISEDDYLNNALKLKIQAESSSSKEEEYNDLRRRLRNYFRKRKCFVFETPTDSIKELKEIEELPDDRLNEKFLSQSALFCDYIFQNAEIKRVDITVDVNGHRLGELANLYTEALNSSNVACLEEVVVSLAEKENKMAVEEGTKLYEDRMKTIVLPTKTLNQFLDLSTQYEEEARKVFFERSIKDTDKKFLNEFMEIVKRTRMEFSVMNEEKSREKCEALIKKHSAGLEKALAEGKFCVPGGHGRFKKSLEAIKKKYNRESKKGVKAEAVLQEYMTSKQTDEILIIQKDKDLSKEQRKKEEENARKQIEEMHEKIQQMQEEHWRQILNEERENYERTIEQLKHKMEEERIRMEEKMEQVLREKAMERFLYRMEGPYQANRQHGDQSCTIS